MKTYTVIVRKKHCLKGSYEDNYNCPLAWAIREQAPEFPLLRVAGWYVRDLNDVFWHFGHMEDNKHWKEGRNMWDFDATKALMKEETKGVAVTFSIEGKGKVEEWKEPLFDIKGDFKEIQFTEIVENIPALSEN